MPWKKDKFVPGNKDILGGNELGFSSEKLISDERILSILEKFSPVLHRGISEAGNFFGVGTDDKLASSVEMSWDELALWEGMFGVTDRVMGLSRAGSLYVPSMGENEKMLPGYESSTVDQFSKAVDLRDKDPKARRVNLDEVVWVPIEPFNPDGMRFMIKPRIYMGGHGGVDRRGKAALYNAFISIDIKAQDQYGRWVVDHIPGTGVHFWDSGPVYSPYRVAGADVWFNTRIDEEKENSLSISVDHPDYLMLHAEIHDPSALREVEVPDDQRLRLFFWQLERFLGDPRLGGKSNFPQLMG